MKGPSLHKGTAGHAKANADFSQMRVNRTMDNTSVADGRAGSSPFQAVTEVLAAATDKDKIKWDKEKKVSETKTKNDKGGEDTKTDYETKGVSKGKEVEKQAKTPEEIAKWKAAPKANKDKYRDKTHTKNRSESSSTKKSMEKIPTLPPKTVKKSNDPKIEPAKDKPRSVETKGSSIFRGGEKTIIGGKRDGKTYKTKSKFKKAISSIKLPKKGVKRRKLCNKKRRSTQCSF